MTHIFLFFLFFETRQGSCPPICGILITNKKLPLCKSGPYLFFSRQRKNGCHLRCRNNVIRKKGCVVQNEGITLIQSIINFSSIYHDFQSPCQPCNRKILRRSSFQILKSSFRHNPKTERSRTFRKFPRTKKILLSMGQ